MQVECSFFDYNLNKFNQYEFDIDLNVYPCCYFYINKLDQKISKQVDQILHHKDLQKLESAWRSLPKLLNFKIRSPVS